MEENEVLSLKEFRLVWAFIITISIIGILYLLYGNIDTFCVITSNTLVQSELGGSYKSFNCPWFMKPVELFGKVMGLNGGGLSGLLPAIILGIILIFFYIFAIVKFVKGWKIIKPNIKESKDKIKLYLYGIVFLLPLIITLLIFLWELIN